MSDNEYNNFIKDRQKEGKALPAGETLKRDAEALKNAETKPAATRKQKEVPEPTTKLPETPKKTAEPAPSPAPVADAPATGSMLGDLGAAKK